MLAYRNPLGILGTLSSDCSLYKTVNHKHNFRYNFRSDGAVCVFIIWLTTPIGQKMLLDLNVAVILTSIL